MQKPHQVKSILCLAALCLSACGTTSGPATFKSSGGMPANSVVLLDPTTDDGMLPALGEGLSRGAVTIYSLDGPSPGITLGGSVPRGGDRTEVAPAVTLRPPTPNEMPTSDPRVTVFSLDSGWPAGPPQAPQPMINPVMAVPLPPPSAVAPAIPSPFGKDGTLRPDAATQDGRATAVTADPLMSPPPVPKAPPAPGTPGLWAAPSPGFSPSWTPSHVMGTGSRAVTATDLMAPVVEDNAAPAPNDNAQIPAKPKKGMTF